MKALFCDHCGSRTGVALHHKKFRSRGGSNDPINLVPLCLKCHADVHAYRGAWAKKYRTHRHQQEGKTEACP